MDKPLSKREVENIVGEKINLITVPELEDYDSIEELMNGNKNLLILYQDYHDDINRVKSGHWTCLKHLDKDNLAFYCSYGIFPDDQLKNIPKEYREQTRQMKRNLTRLLHDSKYKNIHYNPHQHQKKDRNITTCGRHAGLFMHMDTEPEEYNKIIRHLCKILKTDPDNLVVKLTNNLI